MVKMHRARVFARGATDGGNLVAIIEGPKKAEVDRLVREQGYRDRSRFRITFGTDFAFETDRPTLNMRDGGHAQDSALGHAYLDIHQESIKGRFLEITRETHDIATISTIPPSASYKGPTLSDEARRDAEALLEKDGYVVVYMSVAEAHAFNAGAPAGEDELPVQAGWWLFMAAEDDKFVNGTGEFPTRDAALADYVSLALMMGEEVVAPSP